MKIRKLIIPVLLMGFTFSLLLSPNPATPEKKQEEKTLKSQTVVIPQEIKTVFEEGIATRQARLDIPFSILEYFYFPAGDYLHTIIIFKAKNADIGFKSTSPASKSQEKKQEETLTAFETEDAKLQAIFPIYLQFTKLEDNEPGSLVREARVLVNLQEDRISYKPDKEEIYSIGVPLLPGNYLVSMCLATPDLKKFGTQYYEFSLPTAASVTENLETTPIFFVKKIENLDTPEREPLAHKGFFTYSILKVEPNFEKVFSSGEYLELLIYIFGAQPNENNKYNLEVNYEVLKGEEKVVLFAPGIYDSPLIHQPLPLEKTVLVKSGTTETKEKRDIEPGKYTLSITITDKISGKSVSKSVNFEVK